MYINQTLSLAFGLYINEFIFFVCQSTLHNRCVIKKAEHSSTEGLIKTAFIERRHNKEDSKLDFLHVHA